VSLLPPTPLRLSTAQKIQRPFFSAGLGKTWELELLRWAGKMLVAVKTVCLVPGSIAIKDNASELKGKKKKQENKGAPKRQLQSCLCINTILNKNSVRKRSS
jgi:hypothetical protein